MVRRLAVVFIAQLVALTFIEAAEIKVLETLRTNPGTTFRLPTGLKEISGLETSANNTVFCHGDEYAIVYEVDIRTGSPLRVFAMGDPTVKADFEGIALLGERIYLVTSQGRIYEATIGDHKTRARFNSFDTGIGDYCEVEGLSPANTGSADTSDELLILCKTPHDKNLTDHILIFRWNPNDRIVASNPAVSVPIDNISELSDFDSIHPSGIAVDRRTGHILIVAARERLVIELLTTGEIIAVKTLPAGVHAQSEGITVLENGSLVIADESGRNPAQISVYNRGFSE